MKPKAINLFNHVLELKLKKKENKGRLKVLVETLIKELQAQGYDTKGVSGIDYISIFKHSDEYQISILGNQNIEIPFKESEETK